MKIERRGFLAGSAAVLGSQLGAAPAVWADTFPSKPVRWVIPFAPGGNYDVTARIVSDAMSRQLGQTIVIDNRPGSGGVVGLEAAVGAPADGYTIVMASFTVGYVAPIFAGRPQMLQMLAPVSILTTAPTLIVAQAGGRFPDIKTLLAEVKAKPATVTIGHSGNGTTNHVAILRQQLNENLKFNIIPYRGSGPGINDLLSGTIDCFADQLTSSMPHIQSGKLKPLMVYGLERIPELPDVPTLKDAGCVPFEGGTTAGVFVRAETPAPLIARLNEAVVAGLKDPTANKRLRELGAVVRPSTPEQFTVVLKSDEANVAELMEKKLLKPD
jgi:tripartite-type tricarboxylate transporter receptor subunit TctC